MRLALAAAFAVAAAPALAGVEAALDAHILPGLTGFTVATRALAEAARADCTPAALDAPFNAAFDAWTAIGDVRLGPSETAAQAIAFWPDARGFTPRTLTALIAADDPVIDDPDAFAQVSVAGRGLFALEMLLYDEAFSGYAPDSYACRFARRLAADLATHAAGLEAAWVDGYAATLTTAGAADNAAFLDPEEAVRALYTQVLSSLEFTADNRVGRPLGTFDKPQPKRAEAWRSGRSLRNAVLATDAAVDLARALAGWPLPAAEAALERFHAAADKIGDPGFQNVDDPSERFKLEVLQQKVDEVQAAIEQEIGLRLGIEPGFNSQDGD